MLLWKSIFLLCFIHLCFNGLTIASTDSEGEEKAEDLSENDSTVILIVILLLIVTVLTIWLFKVKRFRFFHETGLCLIYGMIAGAILKYTGGTNQKPSLHTNISIPTLAKSIIVSVDSDPYNYSYLLNGKTYTVKSKGGELEEKAVFDPEVFFYALLPPIIFFAGYDMKKRFFFRNLGAILTFAFIGTTISCVVFGAMIWIYFKMVHSSTDAFNFADSLLFGSLISATDPVTVLAIFHDLNVEVDLYAIVFGESVMNDAVAIVLYKTIQSNYSSAFTAASFFTAVGNFIWIFGGSFLLGSAMGLGTALLTKLTHISQFPRLETALFVLMSYSTFLIAESAKLTGIVTVLFCGISQAHYTYNNLSKQSQVATKEIFGVLNFLAENFIFSYMGMTVFTFSQHNWDPGFIAWCFLAIAVSRFLNIYPLSFLMNLKRSKKIPLNFQHMLFFAGLRGAVAFALAIRNTESGQRKLMLTSVLVIAIVTVIFNGGLTTQALLKLGIRVNVDQDEDIETEQHEDGAGQIHEDISYERSWLVRKWHNFDVKYMKPMFTSKAGPVRGDVPRCCVPLASCLSPEERGERYERRSSMRRAEDEHGSIGSVGSIDDDMLDIAVSHDVMTKPPSRELSREEQQPTRRQPEGPSDVNPDGMPLNIIS
eukprot:TCONS_00068622-protein